MIERVRGRLFLVSLLAAACAQSTPAPKTAATAPGASPAAAIAKAPAPPRVGPPLTLMPAATARTYQMATVSAGSIDRLLVNSAKLVSAAVPIPMTPGGARDMLLSEMGLSPEVAANLDLGSPSGAAVVALDDKGKSGVVLAIPTRGPAEADKVIAALGKPVMTSGPLTMLANASGKSQGWVYRAGSVVVLGDEADGMARGAMLALEARRASPDDATVTIFPEAIARAHGTDVKTAIAAFIEQVRQTQAATNPMVPADSAVYEMFGTMLGLVGDAERIEIGLLADPARGLILRGRMFPRPGTKLETAAREVVPFEIDPAVTVGPGAPVMIGAMSIGAVWREILGMYRARIAADKGKGAAAALAYYDAFLNGLSGGQSGIVSFVKERPYVTGAFSTPLKDAATAVKTAAALGKMDNAAMSVFIRSQLGSSSSMLDWTAKRENVGKAKAIHFKVTIKKDSALDSDKVRKWVGSGFDFYQAVAGTRVVVTFGHDARARLAAIAAGKRGAPITDAAFKEAQASAKGRDGFYYFDFAPVLGVVGEVAGNAHLSAAARAGAGPIPLVFTSGGDGAGKTLTMDLTLPLAAFTSIGALIAAGVMTPS
ncbi:MAG TPA: hypothetical protein VI456_13615 [Polyangia bacterium]